MYKASLLLKPLEIFHIFRNLSFGIDYYEFFKDQAGGGIYDGDATLDKGHIGFEIDFRLSWQVLSDFSLSVEYGRFEPGDAYPDSANDTEEYLSIGMNFTF